MKVRALEERQTWPLGCVSGKWWWILLEPKASLSSFLSRCRLHRGSGRLCPHRPGHIWSHTWRGSCWRAGRKGPSLRTHTSGSPSPEAGPEGLLECRGAWQRPFWQPRGPRTSCVTSGPVVEVFSLPMSPPPGLRVGLSPQAAFLHHSSTKARCPVLQPLPVWPPWSHPGLRAEVPQLAGGGTC